MFGRKPGAQDSFAMTQPPQNTKNETAPTASPAARASQPTEGAPSPRQVSSLLSPSPRADMGGRRVVDIPGRRPQDSASQSDMRKLTVGRDITLTGEISTCDILVVEGRVEATLRDGKLIEITENGTFVGSVEIDNADIAGKFEGDLTVHHRLTLRTTGSITGRVRYGELEVQAGGQITGEIQVGTTAGNNVYKTAAKLATFVEEEAKADQPEAERAAG